MLFEFIGPQAPRSGSNPTKIRIAHQCIRSLDYYIFIPCSLFVIIIDMDSSNLSSAPAGSSLLNGCNTALNATCADTLENNELLSSLYTYLPHSLLTLFLGVFTYWLVSHVVLDPPPPKGLKAIPKPRSTLPYLGRIHDVDRFAPWRAMKKFNDRYDGLFQCILGGENHIWVGREDIAYDLLCKNAAICSARGDLGAYPNVTTEGEYLPLLGYTGIFLYKIC